MNTIEQLENWMIIALVNGDFIRYAQYRVQRDDLRQAQAPRCLTCGEDLSALVAELGTGEAAWNAHCDDAH